MRDLTGQRFGRWTVARSSERLRYWQCQCDCGTVREVYGPSLTRGASPSCGCLTRAPFAERWTKHGHARAGVHSVEYTAWCNMRTRCERPSSPMFRHYGERGIYVCRRWRENFDAFLGDVGFRPGPRMSVDRIDVNGSYTCGRCAECAERGAQFNVRWASDREQANNRTNNTFVEHEGERLTISMWAARLGVSPQLISSRLRSGWSAERALQPRMRSGAQPSLN